MKQYNLIITPRAEKRIERVMDYLLETWGKSSRQKFVKELNRCFHIIAHNPFLFPLSLTHNEIRKCVVTPLNIVYYTIINDDVVVLSLEDTRMDPSRF